MRSGRKKDHNDSFFLGVGKKKIEKKSFRAVLWFNRTLIEKKKKKGKKEKWLTLIILSKNYLCLKRIQQQSGHTLK